MTAYDIGFDIGGTKCAVILGDDDGRTRKAQQLLEAWQVRKAGQRS